MNIGTRSSGEERAIQELEASNARNQSSAEYLNKIESIFGEARGGDGVNSLEYEFADIMGHIRDDKIAYNVWGAYQHGIEMSVSKMDEVDFVNRHLEGHRINFDPVDSQIVDEPTTLLKDNNRITYDEVMRAKTDYIRYTSRYNRFTRNLSNIYDDPSYLEKLTERFDRMILPGIESDVPRGLIHQPRGSKVARQRSLSELGLTEQQIAARRGWAIDEKTGDIVPYSRWNTVGSFLGSVVHTIMAGIPTALGGMRDNITAATFGTSPDVARKAWQTVGTTTGTSYIEAGRDLGTHWEAPSMYAVRRNDSSGNPYLAKVPYTDRSVTSHDIVNVWGHRYQDWWLGATLGNMWSVLNPVAISSQILGTGLQWSADVIDLLGGDNTELFESEAYDMIMGINNLRATAGYRQSIRAEQGIFNTWEGFFGLAGMSLAQGFLIAGSTLLTGNPYVGISLLSATAAAEVNTTFNDLGVDRRVAVAALPAIFAAYLATERLIGPNIVQAPRMFKTRMMANRAVKNHVGANKGTRFQQAVERWWTANPKTWAQAMHYTMIEQIGEETLESISENIAFGFADWYSAYGNLRTEEEYKQLYDMGFIPVDQPTTFFEHESGASMWDVVTKNMFHKTLERAMAGYVGGAFQTGSRAILGMPLTPQNTREATLRDAVIDGKGQQADNLIRKYQREGKLGSTQTDIEGRTRAQAENQGVDFISENDYKGEMALADLASYEAEIKALGDKVTSVKGDRGLTGIYLDLTKHIKEEEARIAESKEKGEEVNQNEILEAESRIKKFQDEIDVLMTPVEGKPYSQRFYEEMDRNIERNFFAHQAASEAYAEITKKDVKNLTKRDYISPQYQQLFDIAINKPIIGVSLLSQQYNKDQNEARETYNNLIEGDLKRGATQAISHLETISKNLKNIQQGEITSENIGEVLSGISRNIQDIRGVERNFYLLQEADRRLSESYQEKLQGTMQEVRSILQDLDASISQVRVGDRTILEGAEAFEGEAMEASLPGTESIDIELTDALSDGDPFAMYNVMKRGLEYYTQEDVDLSDRPAVEIENNNTLKKIEIQENAIKELETKKKSDLTESERQEIDKKIAERKKKMHEHKKDLKDPMAFEGLTDNEIYYLGETAALVHKYENIAKKGAVASGLNADKIAAEIRGVIFQLRDIIPNVVDYDAYGQGVFFKNNPDPNLRMDYHNPISVETSKEVKRTAQSFLDRLEAAKLKVDKERGVTQQLEIVSLHPRMAIAILRDMFYEVDGENDPNYAFNEHLKNAMGEDYDGFVSNLRQIAQYQSDTKTMKKKGPYDYYRYELTGEGQDIGVDGNSQGMLSEKGINETIKLMDILDKVEIIIQKHSDKIFDQDGSELFIKRYMDQRTELHDPDSPDMSHNRVRINIMNARSGYMNSKMNYSDNISQLDLMKSVLTPSSTGEVSIFRPIQKINTSTKKENINDNIQEIGADQTQQYAYKYMINYLTTLSQSTTKEMLAHQSEVYEKHEQEFMPFPTTFEQMISVNQAGGFFKGGKEVINNFIDAEHGYFKEALKKAHNKFKEQYKNYSLEKDIQFLNNKNYKNWIDNAFFLQGDYAVGKTESVPLIVESVLKDKLENNEKNLVSVFANTTELRTKLKNEIQEYMRKVYPENKLEVQVFDSREILTVKDAKLGDLTIADEVSLFPDSYYRQTGNKTRLADRFKRGSGRQLLQLGDIYQMKSKSDSRSELFAYTSMASNPMTQRFRSGLAVTNILSDAFRSEIDSRTAVSTMTKDQLPDVAYVIDKDGHKKGAQYFSSVKDIVNSFVNDVNNKDANVLKRLVIPADDDLSNPAYDAIVETNRDGKRVIKDQYQDLVFKMFDDLAADATDIQAIQGSKAEHLYIAIDWTEFGELGANQSAAMMYTAIGRAAKDETAKSNYVALVGLESKNLAESDPDHRDMMREVKPDESRNLDSEKNVVTRIVDENARTTKEREQSEQQKRAKNEKAEAYNEKELGYIKEGYYPTYISKKGDGRRLEKVVGNYVDRVKLDKNGDFDYHSRIFHVQLGKFKGYIAINFNEQNKPTEVVFLDDKNNFKGKKEITINQGRTLFKNLNNANNTPKTLRDIADVEGVAEFSNLLDEDVKVRLPLIEEFSERDFDRSLYAREVTKLLKDNPGDAVRVDFSTDQGAFESSIFYDNKTKEYKVELYREEGGDAINEIEADQVVTAIQDYLMGFSFRPIYNQGQNIRTETEVSSDANQVYQKYTVDNQQIQHGDEITYEGDVYTVSSINEFNGEATVNLTSVEGESSHQLSLEEYFDAKNKHRDKIGYLEGNDVEDIQNKFEPTRRQQLIGKHSPNMLLKVFGMSSYAGDSNSAVRNMEVDDRLKVRRISEFVRQKLLRANQYSDLEVVAKKDFAYITDQGHVGQSHGMVSLVVRTTKELNGEIIRQNIRDLINDGYLESNDLEFYNSNTEAINNALTTLGATENILGIGASWETKQGKLKNKSTLLKDIGKRSSEDSDPSAGIFRGLIETYYDRIESELYQKNNREIKLTDALIQREYINDNHVLQFISPRISLSELENNLTERGFMAQDIYFEQDKDGRVKMLMKVDSPYGTTADVYVYPKTIDSQYIKKLQEEGNRLLELFRKTGTTQQQRIKAMNSSPLFQVVLSNWSKVRGGNADTNPLKGFLSFSEDNGRISLRPKGTNTKQNDIKAIKDYIEFLKSREAANMMKKWHAYIDKDVNADGRRTIKEDYKEFVHTPVENINTANYYVDLKNSENLNEGDTSDDSSIISSFGDSSRTMAKTFYNSKSDMLERKQEFDTYFKRMLGDAWQDFVEFYPQLQSADGTDLWGLYQNKLMKIRTVNGDLINKYAPRHEFFHFFFDMLPQNMQNRIIRAGRVKYAEVNENVTIEEASNLDRGAIEEFLATDFQSYDEGIVGYQRANFGTFEGILEGFKRLVNRIWTFLGGSPIYTNSYLNALYDRIEKGNHVKMVEGAIPSGDEMTMPILGDQLSSESQSILDQTNQGIQNADVYATKSHKNLKKRILEKIGNDAFTFRTIKSAFYANIAKFTVLGDGNKTSIQESINLVRNAYKKKNDKGEEVNSEALENIGNKIIEIDGQNVKVKNVNSVQATKLNMKDSPNDFWDWATYTMGDNIDFFINDLQAYSNNISAWYRFNVTSEQRSIDDHFDEMFTMLLSNIKNLNYKNGEQYSDIRYVDLGTTLRRLKDNATNIKKVMRETNKDAVDAIIEVLNNEANAKVKNDRYASQSYSIAKYLEGLRKKADDRYNNYRDNKDNNSYEAWDMIAHALNRIGSLIQSTDNKTYSEFEITEDGEFKINKLITSKQEQYKNDIKNSVVERTMTTGGISDAMYAALNGGQYTSGGITKNINKTLSVDINGVYYHKGDEQITIIDASGDNIVFTQEARNNPDYVINLANKHLGLNLSRDNIVRHYLEKTNEELESLNKYISRKKKKKEQAIAEMMYAMMLTANEWSEYKTQVNQLIENEVDNLGVEIQDLTDKLNKGTLVSSTTPNVLGNIAKKYKMAKYFNEDSDGNFTINHETIDHIEANFETGYEGERGDFTLRYLKPADFYQFFFALSELETYNEFRLSKKLVFDKTGTSIPVDGLSSSILGQKERLVRQKTDDIKSLETRLKRKENITDAMAKQLIQSGVLGNNYTLVKDKGKWKLQDMSPVPKNLSISSIEKVTTVGEKIHVKEPSPADLVRVLFEAYVDSAMKGGKVNLLLFNIADRNDIYKYSFSTGGIGQETTTKLFNIKKSKDGEYDVDVDNQEVADSFRSIFDYYKHASETSMYKMSNIFRELGITSSEYTNIANYVQDKYNPTKFAATVNNLLKSKAKEGSDLRLKILKELEEGVDYIIDKEGNIQVGRAITYNNDGIWNIRNYRALSEITNDAAYYKELSKLLSNEYVKFTKALSQSGYSIADAGYNNVKGYNPPRKGQHYYYTKDGEYIYNDLAYALFLTHTLGSTGMNLMTVGDFNNFSEYNQLAKRNAPITTPSVVASPIRLYGDRYINKFNTSVIKSDVSSVLLSTEKSKRNPLSADGWAYGTLLGRWKRDLMFGAKFSSDTGAAKKDLIVSDDGANNGKHIVKFASKYDTNNELSISYHLREAELLALDNLSYKVNKELDADYDFKGKFLNYLERFNNNWERAAEELWKVDIISDVNADVIANNTIDQYVDESSVKNKKTGYAPFKINEHGKMRDAYINEVLDGLPMVSMDAGSLRMVTNLNKKVENQEDGQKQPNQLISLIRSLDTDDIKYSKKVESILSQIYDLEMEKMKKLISDTKIGSEEVIGVKRQKILSFIEKIASEMVHEVQGNSAVARILSDPQIDLTTPNVQEDVLRMYRSYLNKHLVDVKLDGHRAILAPASHLTLYTDGKSYYSLSHLENIYGVQMKGQSKVTINKNGEEVELSLADLNAMEWVQKDDGSYEFKPTLGVAANPLMDRMNMRPDESLASVYTFNFIGDEIYDLRDYTPTKQVEESIGYIDEYVMGAEITGFGEDLDVQDTHVLYRNFRERIDQLKLLYNKNNQEKNNEYNKLLNELKNDITDYYNDWNDALDYLDIRIPFGHAGQGNVGRIIEFTSDDNIIYQNMAVGVRSDVDVDGDENNIYIRAKGSENLSKIDELKLDLFNTINDAYRNPENRAKIDISSDVENIRGIIEKFTKTDKKSFNNLGGQVETYGKAKGGIESVGLFANLNSAFHELAALQDFKLKNKQFDTGVNAGRNIGNWLQVALDYSKTGIGDLGIPSSALSLLPAYLAIQSENYNTETELNERAVSFFTNSYVKNVLRDISNATKISEYYSGDVVMQTIFKAKEDIVDKTRNTLNPVQIDGKTLQGQELLNYYKENVKNKKDLIKDTWQGIAKLLNDNRANDLWKILKGKNTKHLIAAAENANALEELLGAGEVTDATMSKATELLGEVSENATNINTEDIQKLVARYGGDIGVIAKQLYKELEGIKELHREIANQTKVIRVNEAMPILNELYDTAVKGKAYFRISRLIGIRNGIPTQTHEQRALKSEIEKYLGMSFEDFFDNKKASNLSDHIEFYKRNNNDFLKSSDINEIRMLENIETDIYNAFNTEKKIFNAAGILRTQGFDKYRKSLRLIHDPYFGNDSPFQMEHKLFESALNRYISWIYAVPTKMQQLIFDRNVRAYFADYFFKKESPRINLFDDVYDLRNALDREAYKRAFPRFYQALKEMSDDRTPINDDEQFGSFDANAMRNTMDDFQNNKFLMNYHYNGTNNAYLTFDRSMQFDEADLHNFRIQFQRMAPELQELIFYYELIKNQFEFKSGSAYDLVPTSMYKNMNNHMKDLFEELDNIYADGDTRNDFLDNFVEMLTMNHDAVNYMSVKQKEKRQAVAPQKLPPGDQMQINRSGISYYGKAEYQTKDGRKITGVFNARTEENTVVHNKGNYNHNGINSYESDTQKQMKFSEYTPIRALGETSEKMFQARKRGEDLSALSYDHEFNQEATYDESRIYMDSYGTLLKLKPMGGRTSNGVVYSRFYRVRPIQSSEKKHAFHGQSLGAATNKNTKHENNGLTEAHRTFTLSNIPGIIDEGFNIIALSNSMNFPVTGTQKALTGDSNEYGVSENNEGYMTKGPDALHVLGEKGVFPVDVVKAEKGESDRESNAEYIKYSEDVYSDREVIDNLKIAFEHALNNPDQNFMVLHGFDSNSTNRLYKDSKDRQEVLDNEQLSKFMARAYAELEVAKIDNVIFANAYQASIFNEALIEYGKGQHWMPRGLKAVKTTEQKKTVNPSQYEVSDIIKSIDENALNAFQSIYNVKEINTVEEALGVKQHLEAENPIDLNRLGEMENNTPVNEFTQDQKALGLPLALYYAYKNKGRSLRLNPDGTNNSLWHQVHEAINDPVLAYRVRAAVLNNIKTQQILEGESKQIIVRPVKGGIEISDIAGNNIVDIRYSNILQNIKHADPSMYSFINRSIESGKREYATALFKKLAKASNTRVIIETKQTAKEKTGREDRRGWWSSEGLHFVQDNINADTPVHELTEMFLFYVKENNIVAYNRLLDQAREHMKNNEDIVEAIENSYRFERGSEDMLREYIATISGFNSAERVLALLNESKGSEYAHNNTNNVISRAINFVKEIWNTIKDALSSIMGPQRESYVRDLDLTQASLEDIMNAISLDFVEGNSIFSSGEVLAMLEMLGRGTDTGSTFFSNNLGGLTKIESIKDFYNYLMTSEKAPNLENVFLSKRQRAEYYYKFAKENESGQLYLKHRGSTVNLGNRLPNNAHREKALKQIENHYLPLVDKNREKISGKLENLMYQSKDQDVFLENILELAKDPKTKLSYHNTKRLFDLSGLRTGYESIMKLSDLANSDNALLKSLYNKDLFRGYDPYIIVHGEMGGKLSISLLEITHDNLRVRNKDIQNRNLLGRILSDKEYGDAGGTLTNNMLGIKQLEMTFLAAHILKYGKDRISINNMSVFGIPYSDMAYSVIQNPSLAFKDLKIMAKQSEIMDNIDNMALKSLLEDTELLSTNHEVSYLELLSEHVDTEDKSFSNLVKDAATKLRDSKFSDVDKRALIDGLKRRMRKLEALNDFNDLQSNREYEFLSHLIMEYDARMEQNFYMKKVPDMSKFAELIKTPQDIQEPIAQAIISAYLKAKYNVLEGVKNSIKELAPFRNKFISKNRFKEPGYNALSYIMNVHSKLFESMYQKRDVWVTENNQRVKKRMVIPFLIHHDINDANTKRALDNNEIDMETVAYGRKVKEILEKEMIEHIKWDEYSRTGKQLTDEQALDLYDNTNTNPMSDLYGSFMVPVIQRSRSEHMLKAMKSLVSKNEKEYAGMNFNKAIDKLMLDTGNQHDLFYEIAGQEKTNEVTSAMVGQMGDFTKALEAAGMRVADDGSLELYRPDLYSTVGTNIESLTHSFILASKRKRIYEHMYMPVYNSGMFLLSKKEQMHGTKLKNAKNWIQENMETLVKRESPDMQSPSKAYRQAARLIRYTSRLYSNMTLGLNLRVATKSLSLMQAFSWTGVLADEMARLGVPEETLNTDYATMFRAKDWRQSHGYAIKNWGFSWTLARKFQAIEGQEMDIMHNPIINVSKRYAAQDYVLHSMNWGGDNLIRTMGVIAYLKSKGSLDAYSYNKNTGEITYDVKKDRQYYDENGKLKPGAEAMMRAVWEDNTSMAEGGFQDANVSELQWGESYKGMYRTKQIMDKHVIGAMSEEARWQIANHAAGRALTTFRAFGSKNVNRWLLGNHETILNTDYKVTKDQYGNEMVYHDIKQIEGMLKTAGTLYGAVIGSIKNKSLSEIKEWWTEGPHERRVNLSRFLLQMAAQLMIFAAMKSVIPDEEEDIHGYRVVTNYQRYYKFLYQDLFELYFVGGVAANPIPVIQMVEDVYGVLLNEKEWEVFNRYIPGKAGSYDFLKETIEVSQAYLEDDFEGLYERRLEERRDRMERRRARRGE